jgi:hypothetical protein
MRWGPRANAYEEVSDGRFRFHVALSLPLAGLIVRYEGWLKRTAAYRHDVGASVNQ